MVCFHALEFRVGDNGSSGYSLHGPQTCKKLHGSIVPIVRRCAEIIELLAGFNSDHLQISVQ